MDAQLQVAPAAEWKNLRLRGRIEELDGLRGIAILLVLAYHYLGMDTAPGHPAWGMVIAGTKLFWSGVDLFFVLSGFLICGILLDSADSTRYFKTFYMRRFHRIFPLYFIWLGLFYAGIWMGLDHKLNTTLFRNGPLQNEPPLWLYPVFLQNNASIWFNAVPPSWMNMSWSLAVEEQFYIVLPGIVRSASKNALKWLCTAVIFGSIVWRTVMVATNAPLGWEFATFSRLDGLAMGAAIAVFLREREHWQWLKERSAALRVLAPVLLLCVLVLGYGSFPPIVTEVYKFTFLAAFYGSLVLLAICQPASGLSALLRSAFLRYFGRISYAVYIMHQGIRGLVEKAVPMFAAALRPARYGLVLILAVLITILLSEISWRLMESKLIRRAHLKYKY